MEEILHLPFVIENQLGNMHKNATASRRIPEFTWILRGPPFEHGDRVCPCQW